MLLSRICFFVFLFSSVNGFSHEQTSDKQATSEKKFAAFVKAGIVGAINGYGFGASYTLNHHLKLEVSGLQASEDLTSSIQGTTNDNYTVTKAEAKINLYDLRLRIFNLTKSSSFNFFAGAGYRDFDMHVRAASKFLGDEYGLIVDTGGPAIHFGIGNYWKISESFVIAADWLSVSIPISNEFDVIEEDVNNDLERRDIDRYRELGESQAGGNIQSLFNFSFAYLF